MQNEVAATLAFRAEAQARATARQDDTTIPQVGDLATITFWSDRSPARVIAVSKSGHQVTLARLDHTVISGSVVDGSAKYSIAFHPRADASTERATRRANGRYRLAGWQSGGAINFGHADVYRDPSF